MKLLDVYLDNNIGDDLMLKMFLKHYSKYEFVIVNNNSEIMKTFQNYNNLKFVTNSNSIDYKQITHYITIGGSVFNNANSFIGKLMRLKRIFKILSMKKNGVKVITLGSNLGPFKDKVGEKIVNKEIELYDLITLRDEYSFKLAKQKNKYLFNDIVTSLNKYYIDYSNYKIENGVIGISLHNNSNERINEKVIREVSDSINKINELNSNFKFRFFNFDTMNENDAIITEKVVNKLDENVIYEEYSYIGTNQDEFIKAYAQCEFIFGLRFHSLILATVFKNKFLGYSYSNKMIDYAKDRNFTNIELIKDISSIKISDLEQYTTNTHNEENGYKHFEMLEELLK